MSRGLDRERRLIDRNSAARELRGEDPLGVDLELVAEEGPGVEEVAGRLLELALCLANLLFPERECCCLPVKPVRYLAE